MARRFFRADAAFAMREVSDFLQAGGCEYTVRMPANAVLKECIACLMGRPAGRMQHDAPGRAGDAVPQPSRPGGAVDQGRQGRFAEFG
jgi:hypothetical protein